VFGLNTFQADREDKTIMKFIAVVSLLLALHVGCLAGAPLGAAVPGTSESRVKAAIASLGVGPAARVKIKTRDGSKLSGYVSDSGESAVTITTNNGKSVTVLYSNVKRVKGHNRVTGKDILAGIGLVWFGLILVLCVTTDTCMN
jgi:hypothetical protein